MFSTSSIYVYENTEHIVKCAQTSQVLSSCSRLNSSGDSWASRREPSAAAWTLRCHRALWLPVAWRRCGSFQRKASASWDLLNSTQVVPYYICLYVYIYIVCNYIHIYIYIYIYTCNINTQIYIYIYFHVSWFLGGIVLEPNRKRLGPHFQTLMFHLGYTGTELTRTDMWKLQEGTKHKRCKRQVPRCPTFLFLLARALWGSRDRSGNLASDWQSPQLLK